MIIKINRQNVGTIGRFTYLGNNGNIETDIKHGTGKAVAVFQKNMLSCPPILSTYAQRSENKSIILPTVFFVSETWEEHCENQQKARGVPLKLLEKGSENALERLCNQ